MITVSMTYKEMYDHLAADLEKVKYRKEYFLPKAIKEFRKAKNFPVWKWYEYIVPNTRNKYVIYYYAENASCIEKPKIGSFVEIFFERQRFIVRWGAGGYRHTPNSRIKSIRQIHAYTSHFLSRYKNRCLKNDDYSSNDIACHFFSRNEEAIPIEINESINKNIEKYGEEAKDGYRVRDGFCFTKSQLEGEFYEDREKDRVDAMIIVYTTFISKSEMTESQINAIEEKNLESWNQFLADFMKEAKNGVLKLKLEP